VLIIGSGHATHNLRDWRNEPLRYAQDFAAWVHERLVAGDTDSLIAYRELAHRSRARIRPKSIFAAARGQRRGQQSCRVFQHRLRRRRARERRLPVPSGVRHRALISAR
jgi:aromatic ring-opening dioxygenase catalytic subunit (LigB family)